MNTITTHALNTATGKPAANLTISLFRVVDEEHQPLVVAQTNQDGRVEGFTANTTISSGVYLMRFHTGAYFKGLGVQGFYPQVDVLFEIIDATSHYHIPLLISPYGYSTYRGS